MDDDLLFGASVWGAPSPSIPPPSKPNFPTPSEPQVETLDDFDDFDEAPVSTGGEGDDFGDFGDFGEPDDLTVAADFGDNAGFQMGEPSMAPERLETDWKPLKLDPMPSTEELTMRVNELLEPLWRDLDTSQFNDEGIREVEGVSQILVTPESRALYNRVAQPLPMFQPFNWTRSRIRRQHLIALGIPVNLDEVLPHANGKPLPPLQITTRPTPATTPAGTPRGGSPKIGAGQASGKSNKQGIAPKPALDYTKISTLLDLNPESLTLAPLPILERHLVDLREETANTSAMLTYLLQARELLQQDSETYNGLIAELVGEAQKIKTGKSKVHSKRGSGMA